MELRTRGEKVFAVFNYVLMALISVITLYPVWHILMSSISDPIELLGHRGFYFWPRGTPNIRGYILVFENPNIVTSYLNTIYYVIVGTTLSIITTIMGAYALSRKGLYWNKFIMKMIIFTMYFHGGLLPWFIQVRNMGLIDSRWAIILPMMIGTFNLIILRTAFQAAPDSLIESAKLDGCGELRVLWQIVVPVTKAAISVITLFYAVTMWNMWFNAAIFLNDRSLWPLQLVLRDILINNDTGAMTQVGTVGQLGVERYRVLVRYSTIIVATLPILLIYPFIQKYFVSGVMIGSLKE
jgi:putative aldouronate transport system permease protein